MGIFVNFMNLSKTNNELFLITKAVSLLAIIE